MATTPTTEPTASAGAQTSTAAADPSAATSATTSAGGAHLPGSRPVVAAQRLTKVFRDFWWRDRARAVDALTFEIHPHEIFGLLGPNGSGKSTTIKMILGLLRPTSGRLLVFGKAPSDVATKRRIGYLPEESYLYPFLNARETLDYYGKLFQIERRVRERRIDELLDMVGLTHAQFRPVHEYSKGMQRRIGLAQALINDPDFLILDEPTTGLDPIGTRQVKDLIIELGRRGKTVLLSSHLLADVEDVADRLTILYGGKPRGEGTVSELLETTERTSIVADALDEDTIAEIDEVIRRRSGGAKSIRQVQRPRQRLEELFLGIVERAQAERLATSGASNAGATAAFLRADEDDATTGEALIAELMTEGTGGPDGDQPDGGESEADRADRLLSEVYAEDAGGDAAPPPEAEAAAQAEHDQAAVIEGLLSGDGRGEDEAAADRADTTAPANQPEHTPAGPPSPPPAAGGPPPPPPGEASAPPTAPAAGEPSEAVDDSLIASLLEGSGDEATGRAQSDTGFNTEGQRP